MAKVEQIKKDINSLSTIDSKLHYLYTYIKNNDIHEQEFKVYFNLIADSVHKEKLRNFIKTLIQ